MAKTLNISINAYVEDSDHVNVLTKLAKLSEVTAGILSDRATGSYKRDLFLDYDLCYQVNSALLSIPRDKPQNTHGFRHQAVLIAAQLRGLRN